MMILYFIGGSKGGVGKSFLSMALADFLTKYKNRKIILVESDTSNPDVGKTFAHNDDVEVLSLSLDNADGWIELVNSCEGSNRDLVVNSAARSGEAIEKFVCRINISISRSRPQKSLLNVRFCREK